MSSCDHFVSLPGHEFWPDELSLTDQEKIDLSRLLHDSQITDTSLLALAAGRKGKLATFDQELITNAVPKGDQFIERIRQAGA